MRAARRPEEPANWAEAVDDAGRNGLRRSRAIELRGAVSVP